VEYGEEVVFMHAVKEGPANRSFGLSVAALAGLPRPVIAQARRYLAALESHAPPAATAASALEQPQQMGLFAEPSAAERALREVDPDELTPKAALEVLYRLRSLL
jgi:DNA mismatch repair protein MutS